MPTFYGIDVTSSPAARHRALSVTGNPGRCRPQSKTDIVTVSLRREMAGGRSGGAFFEMIRALGVRVLPNTAGCHGVSEAVLTAKMAREVFATNWIKLEVIGNHDTLQPDVFGLVEAARILESARASRSFPTPPTISSWPNDCWRPVARC
jgi:thiazole synthase